MSQVEKEIRDTLSIAKMHLFEGKYDEAFKMSKDIFEMTNKYFESDPCSISKAKTEMDFLLDELIPIAKMHLYEGKYDEAFKMSKDIFEMTNKYFESGPRSILKTKHELDSLLDALLPIAKMHLHEGKYDEAFKMSKDVYEISNKYFGSDHHITLQAKQNMNSANVNQDTTKFHF